MAGPITAEDNSDILVFAEDLARKLDQMFGSTPNEESRSEVTSSDSRLEMLSPYPSLQKQVRFACKARSLSGLESELNREGGQSC